MRTQPPARVAKTRIGIESNFQSATSVYALPNRDGWTVEEDTLKQYTGGAWVVRARERPGEEMLTAIPRDARIVFVLFDGRADARDGRLRGDRRDSQPRAGRRRARADHRHDRTCDAGHREECLDAGMSDYLTKPISVQDLTRTIARACAVAPLTGRTPAA